MPESPATDPAGTHKTGVPISASARIAEAVRDAVIHTCHAFCSHPLVFLAVVYVGGFSATKVIGAIRGTSVAFVDLTELGDPSTLTVAISVVLGAAVVAAIGLAVVFWLTVRMYRGRLEEKQDRIRALESRLLPERPSSRAARKDGDGAAVEEDRGSVT